MIADLLVRPDRIPLCIKRGKVDRFAKPDADLGPAGPVADDLPGEIVDQSRDKYRNDLRLRFVDDLADARLGRQEIVRIIRQVSLPLGVKPDHVPATERAKPHKLADRKLVEDALPRFFL